MAGSRTHWFADEGFTEHTTQLTGQNLSRARAMRLQEGETILVTDGKGGLATCEITAINRDHFDFIQLALHRSTPPAPRMLIQALTKHDPVESALRLAIEFGATAFTPWQANRSVARWNEQQAERQLQRLTAIAVDQALVNHFAWFARVNSLSAQIPEPQGMGLILAPDAELQLADLIRSPNKASELAESAVTLVVGPEGGLTDAEIDRAKVLGYTPVTLGSVSYRSVSAGAAALALLGSTAHAS